MLHLKEKLLKSNGGFKGIGNLLSVEEIKTEHCTEWNILKENVSLPTASLSESILKHNQLWMQKFSEKFEFQLAPHGKTTMLPDIFKLQVSSGCWGITLATAHQVAVAFKSGVKRTILANQLVGNCNMDIISSILHADPDFEFICVVDSVRNVAQLGKFFSERNQKIKVLLEYGPVGGRTGIRNEAQETSVVKELQMWNDTISLVGIEFFEGILKEEKEIREFIRWTLSRIESLVNLKAFSSTNVIITGAGTSWFDVVAEEFQKFEQTFSAGTLQKILRSGCYLIYDIGLYEKVEKRVLEMKLGRENQFSILNETLKPSLKIWAYVHSIPESDLAIIGMGRRDVATDSGYPVPYLHFRPGNSSDSICKVNDLWKIFHMMDQHAYMRINKTDDIQVGDILSFDIYHPCTTMDKWKNVLLIDDDFNVIDVLNSGF
ncbi:unnamed protein product [Orchesella dallaii]|uniref:D-serine dehydratase-like domain-containing protein n=1 Tax=Orchesella dallaii TaxID=48710 RepID=A0ABP1PUJ3_9HEXA